MKKIIKRAFTAPITKSGGDSNEGNSPGRERSCLTEESQHSRHAVDSKPIQEKSLGVKKTPGQHGRPLSDKEYEDIFNAALARCSPVQEESEEEKDDDSEDHDFDNLDLMPDEIRDEIKHFSENEVKPFDVIGEWVPGEEEKQLENNLVANKPPISAPPPQKKKSKFLDIGQPKTGFNRNPVQKKIKVPKDGKKERLLEREIEETGTWVQCSKNTCKKWRFLPDLHDPAVLPELWNCHMNSDPDYNSCEKMEQSWDENEHDQNYVFTRYTEGSVVWARMAGYPWWPALVEIDPDYETFFECRHLPNIASHYHVVFLDDKVSRAWLGVVSLMPFTGDENARDLSKRASRASDKKAVAAAKERGIQALKLSISDRLKQFGFLRKYTGRVAAGYVSDLDVTSEEEQKPRMKKTKKSPSSVVQRMEKQGGNKKKQLAEAKKPKHPVKESTLGSKHQKITKPQAPPSQDIQKPAKLAHKQAFNKFSGVAPRLGVSKITDLAPKQGPGQPKGNATKLAPGQSAELAPKFGSSRPSGLARKHGSQKDTCLAPKLQPRIPERPRQQAPSGGAIAVEEIDYSDLDDSFLEDTGLLESAEVIMKDAEEVLEEFFSSQRDNDSDMYVLESLQKRKKRDKKTKRTMKVERDPERDADAEATSSGDGESSDGDDPPGKVPALPWGFDPDVYTMDMETQPAEREEVAVKVEREEENGGDATKKSEEIDVESVDAGNATELVAEPIKTKTNSRKTNGGKKRKAEKANQGTTVKETKKATEEAAAETKDAEVDHQCAAEEKEKKHQPTELMAGKKLKTGKVSKQKVRSKQEGGSGDIAAQQADKDKECGDKPVKARGKFVAPSLGKITTSIERLDKGSGAGNRVMSAKGKDTESSHRDSRPQKPKPKADNSGDDADSLELDLEVTPTSGIDPEQSTRDDSQPFDDMDMDLNLDLAGAIEAKPQKTASAEPAEDAMSEPLDFEE